MRMIVIAALGLVGGFIAGVVVDQVVAIVGFALFDHAVGIKFLPIYLAVVGVVAAPIVDTRVRRKSVHQ